MTTRQHPWHRAYLHDNHKFIRGTAPRTAREAFGQDIEPPANTADKVVFWVCAAGAALLLVIGVW